MKSVLGRGLESLIPARSLEPEGHVVDLPIHEIFPNPNQPRKQFNEEKLAELVSSLRTHGLLQPIVVTRVNQGYQIVVGERRWRAAKAAGFTRIPALVKDFSPEDRIAVALVENIQRHDLNALEEAEAFRLLIESHGLTQEHLSVRIGKSRPHITNTIRLLQLPEEIKSLLMDGKISSGHARALLAVEDSRKALELAMAAVRDELSVREIEARVRQLLCPPLSKGKATRSASVLERRLSKALGKQVRIRQRGTQRVLEVACENERELKKFVKRFVPLY